MAKDQNGNALTINDWVEYVDEFMHRLGLPTVMRGQITNVIDRDNGWCWVYVDWVNSNATAPVAACKVKLLHSY